MTKSKMLEMLKGLTGENDENILRAFLSLAAEEILKKRYPFKEEYDEDDLEPKYHGTQLKIAVYLLNKRGAEGQISHNENGISRTYESADVPESMLSGVVPVGKVI